MNYYQILEVSKNATQEEIRESYKTLIKKYHPDIYKGDKKTAEKITSALNEAYDILSVPEKRAEYDLSIFPPEQPKTIYYDIKEETPLNQTSQQSSNANFKKKVYKYVDEYTKTLTYQTKITIVLAIIFIAFLLTLISLNDYLRIINMQTIKENMITDYPSNLYNTINENTIIQENIVTNNVFENTLLQNNIVENDTIQNNVSKNIIISNNITIN